MQGKRRADEPDGVGVVYAPGDYGRICGEWHACTPNGLLAGLAKHSVAEHIDGTITVSPSILVRQGIELGDYSWHGYLKAGVFESC